MGVLWKLDVNGVVYGIVITIVIIIVNKASTLIKKGKVFYTAWKVESVKV